MHLLGLLNQLQQWDQDLFNLINNKLNNPFFDAFMPFLRISYVWAPFYLFIIVFVCVNYGRKGLWWIILFLCTVALADMVGTNVFKHNLHRIRPCNTALFPHLRLLVVCPSGYGFTSNHAANHFGMATFIFLTFRGVFKKWAWLIFVWAGLICYAQVYVGVHYPGDIIGGAILGICFALLTSYIFNRYIGKIPAGPH
jgi:membrane-associated phospholipid phosphatase